MRHSNDFYETAPYQTRALLAHQRIGGMVLEPCVGDGSIIRVIAPYCERVITNDIDSTKSADYNFDAAQPDLWRIVGSVDWVITNPPFTQPTCLEILDHALYRARIGVIVMQRISFDEPTSKDRPNGYLTPHPLYPRGKWLADHPIDRRLVLPRHSFSGNGRSDATTTVWFLWIKDSRWNVGRPNISLHDARRRFSDARHEKVTTCR